MKTTNYENFKFMSINRSINKALVSRLVKSISEIGYIDARPILVNESMVIIDGQHRFEACKFLGIPIVYEISNVDMAKAMVALNMNQEIWRLNEYVESYANSGIECYKYLVNFQFKYSLGVSNNILICTINNSHRANNIRTGKEFEVNPNAENIALFILECKQYFSFYKHSYFVAAVTVLFKKTSIENCMKLLEKIQPLRQQPSLSSYLNVFENILNKNKKNELNKISLF